MQCTVSYNQLANIGDRYEYPCTHSHNLWGVTVCVFIDFAKYRHAIPPKKGDGAGDGDGDDGDVGDGDGGW